MCHSRIMLGFLLGLLFLAICSAGCGDEPGQQPPSKPRAFTKKISLQKEGVSKGQKPLAQETAKTPTPEGQIKPAGVTQPKASEPAKAIVQAKEATPPFLVEKKSQEPQADQKSEQVLSEETKPLSEEPAEKLRKRITYFYDPKGKLDPFQPIFAATGVKGVDAKKKIKKKWLPVTPLQKVDLSQLKVVGIIISPAGNKALVEEPSGKGYVISKGTYVGKNFGQVLQILRDSVIVEEEVEDFVTGKLKPQRTQLRLQKKAGDIGDA